MERKKIIAAGLVILGVIVLIAGIMYKRSSTGEWGLSETPYSQETSTAEPVDIALDFYNPWLEAVRSTSTNPYTEGLPARGIVSQSLRERLVASEQRAEGDIDPVLCQTTVPERVVGRIVSEQENSVRVLVNTKKSEITAQSLFVLTRQGEGLFIDDIECYPGEFDIPREFSFETEGFILKSVPPPYTAGQWHLVFEDNGEQGHVVPLFFNPSSSCTALDGNVAPCAPENFTEAKRVKTYGQMTERGVDIVRIEFLE